MSYTRITTVAAFGSPAPSASVPPAWIPAAGAALIGSRRKGEPATVMRPRHLGCRTRVAVCGAAIVLAAALLRDALPPAAVLLSFLMGLAYPLRAASSQRAASDAARARGVGGERVPESNRPTRRSSGSVNIAAELRLRELAQEAKILIDVFPHPQSGVLRANG
jgi:hypothetical protein